MGRIGSQGGNLKIGLWLSACAKSVLVFSDYRCVRTGLFHLRHLSLWPVLATWHIRSLKTRREQHFYIGLVYNLPQAYGSNFNFVHVNASNLTENSTFSLRNLSVKRTSYCNFMAHVHFWG